jgi:hypothetical protein
VKTAFAVLGTALLLAGPARAERSSTRLTPGKADNGPLTFTITAERVTESGGEVIEVKVTVAPKDPKQPRLPHRTGRLEVRDGAALVASCDVRPTGRDDTGLTFTFRVAPKYAAASTFTFAETVNLPVGDQGAYYWFHPGDFAARK